MKTTLATGIPAQGQIIITPYGRAQVRGFREDGAVDIYVGGGRTFRVDGKTEWTPA